MDQFIQPGPTLALPTRSNDTVIAELLNAKQTAASTTKIVTPGTKKLTGDELETVDPDQEEEDLTVIKPRKVSERKRVENVAFEAHIERVMRLQNKKAIAFSVDDEEQRTTEWLVQQEQKPIIESPRDYQVELFERAKEKNIIAVLDTGSGKTLIAVLLLRHMINLELEHRTLGNAKRISFFLVDSVTLVYQQYAVLDCNLDQPMERFSGNMGCDLWSKEVWTKYFNENMVIVCTADVLYHCLHHSYVTIPQINLLIFDEAHHAKKNHAYARIIKDFYAQEKDTSRLPKIFGMTASPVDTRDDVQKAAAELEGLLHSQIATASDPSLLQYTTSKCSEQITTYPSIGDAFETPLFQRMKALVGKPSILSKPQIFARNASCELGSWCSDQIWRICLTDEETKRLAAKLEHEFLQNSSGEMLDVLETHKSRLEEARLIVNEYDFKEPHATLEYLSTKVLKLVQYLQERYERPTSDKCIVFVKQRYTAKLLVELFSYATISTSYLRVGVLVGATGSDAGDMKASFRQQTITMAKFRKGSVNCLFATSVAEEGLDVPDCNLVIRFDLYTTVIQYIQSRGRARQVNSRYIHMIEEGNRVHTATVKEVRKNEKELREFCHSLPSDRLLTGNNYNMDYFLSKERKHRVYTVPETGAKLTYRLSLTVLASFVASLPQGAELLELKPQYVITSQNKDFICEVILPPNSPVGGAMGRPMSTKQVAKCSAAFEACLLLRQSGHLDANFLSTFKKQLPAMREAHLAVTSKNGKTYDMRAKPSLWLAHEIPNELFLTVLALVEPAALNTPSQPLGLLTRRGLPELPRFPLFFGKGRWSPVLVRGSYRLTTVDLSNLQLFNTFTLRIFLDIFSKDYEADIASMPYFLVPIENSMLDAGSQDPSELIAWDILSEVQKLPALHWDDDMPETFFENKYIVDPNAGSRKFWSLKVSHDYRPTDPIPPGTLPFTARGKKSRKTIMDYSSSLYTSTLARTTYRENQPVIEAELIPLARNFLDEHETKKTIKRCFLILEPLKISALPSTVVSMAYTFPSIIHRIESYMIALEACSMLHLHVRPDLALEALTKDSDNTEGHDEDQIKFQRGMGSNYERLEFLGDTFLKMATSIALYTQHPESNEYDFHVRRMLMICNQNLLNNAINLKIYEYIRSQNLQRGAWYPTGLKLLKGKKPAAIDHHTLGDKTIADVCEALIGAALLTYHGTDNVDNAVRAVTELVCSTDHSMLTYADYYKLYDLPKYQTSKATASQVDLAKQIEAKHAYHFRYPRLLRCAFIHPSYPFSYEHIPSYQRLEFLGDSLLDMACINFLFHRFPTRDPQWLTEHKMSMVSNHFLGALCVSLGFQKHVLHFNGKIQQSINNYVAEISEARLQAEEKARSEGTRAEDCQPDYWLETTQPPKCLPDIVEAYIGALFVDSEYNYGEVERFFNEHMRWFFEDMSLYDTYANKHPVTLLGNFLGINMGCQNWSVRASQLPDCGDGAAPQIIATVMVHNQVIADHQGSSARYAKVAVAKKAMNTLFGLSPTEFRVEYHCDCQAEEDEKEGEDVGAGDDAAGEHTATHTL